MRLEIGEHYINKVNGDRTDANVIEYHKRDKEMKTLTVLKHRLINIQAPKEISTHLRIY